MTIDEFIAAVEDKQARAPLDDVARFEERIGRSLPDDYRSFLIKCNGGYVGGRYWFRGVNPAGEQVDAGVHHIGGFRKESYFSLVWSLDCYDGRIPRSLVWIHDDPFGNAVCIGIEGPERGRIYFWDHESEPDEDWDGSLENAGNLTLVATSFADYVAGLQELEEE